MTKNEKREFTIFHKIAYEDWVNHALYPEGVTLDRYMVLCAVGTYSKVFKSPDGEFLIEQEGGMTPHEIEFEECKKGVRTHFTCLQNIYVTTSQSDEEIEKALKKLLRICPPYLNNWGDIEIDYETKEIDFDEVA